MITALVTGIGGTRSIAVAEALRMSKDPIRIIGTDANYFNAGSFQCDVSFILPLASSPRYIDELRKIITNEAVDIIFGTVEKEVKVLSKHKAEFEAMGVSVIVPDYSILEICFDKFKTQNFLSTNGFTSIPCIYSSDSKVIDEFVQVNGLPVIRKPVFGYGSKGLTIINSQEGLLDIPLDQDFVIQKYIENDDTEKYYNTELNEYTAEIFVNKDFSVAGGIIIKRALHAGETVAGYVVKDEPIINRLSTIARTLKIRGPCNFQFRISKGDIYVFEINPLFSGTTAIRANLGFNSVLLAVKSFVEDVHERITQDQLKSKYFLRYLKEIYIEKEKLEEFRDNGVIKNE